MIAYLPRVVTASGAAALGWTEDRVRTELRHGRWRRLASAVYLTRPDPPTRWDWAQVGMTLGGPDAALSGWDVARLRGLGTSWPPTSWVLVLTSPGVRNRQVGQVRLRPSGRPVAVTTLAADDELLPGARIAGTARAIADTALCYRQLSHVRAMVTASIQRELCSPEDLARELNACPRNGSALLRRAVADLRDDVHSVAEAEAVAALRARGIRDFLANAPILDRRGTLLCRVDLLWPELAAIIEIDSREFHFTEASWKETMTRHNLLTGLGYAVKHYPPSAVRADSQAWAGDVADWLAHLARR